MSTVTENFAPKNIKARKAMDIKSGDVVKVYQKIPEKNKTRIQVFEGLVIATKHGKQPGATFTVRKISNGVGVERIFPLYSPLIDKIEIIRRSKVRRSKLYYIREKVSRQIRRKLRNFVDYFGTSDGLYVPEEEMLEEGAENAEEEEKNADAGASNQDNDNGDVKADENENPERKQSESSDNDKESEGEKEKPATE